MATSDDGNTTSSNRVEVTQTTETTTNIVTRQQQQREKTEPTFDLPLSSSTLPSSSSPTKQEKGTSPFAWWPWNKK
jgi:hypothetical protein